MTGPNMDEAHRLPPLPKPHQKGWIYTADQMRAYAAAALAQAAPTAASITDARIFAIGAENEMFATWMSTDRLVAFTRQVLREAEGKQ